MPTQEWIWFIIPALLLIGVIAAAIITRNNKTEQDDEMDLRGITEAVKTGVQEGLKGIMLPNIQPTQKVEQTVLPPEAVTPITPVIEPPKVEPKVEETPVTPIQPVVEKAMELTMEQLRGTTTVVTPPEKPIIQSAVVDMDKVIPAPDGYKEESGTESSGLMEKAKSLIPSIVVLGLVWYMLSGYVKIPNYAADAKGLNDKINQAANTTNTAIAGLTQQINAINADLGVIRSKEQTDIKNVSGNIQGLQTSVTTLQQKTANITK